MIPLMANVKKQHHILRQFKLHQTLGYSVRNSEDLTNREEALQKGLFVIHFDSCFSLFCQLNKNELQLIINPN